MAGTSNAPFDKLPPSSVLGSRLAADPVTSPPTLDDLGLAAAKTAAFDWQQVRSRAKWHEIVVLNRGTGADWVPEIHGILGVVGEQILVAIEAEVEKAILADRLAMPDATSGQVAAWSRALRFFAEGQGNALVVAGHGIANLALRTLMLHPSFTLPKTLGVKQADLVPQSSAKSAWISLTPSGAASMLDAAKALPGSPADMIAFAQRVLDLVNEPAFSALIELRNVQYHRWRGESPGVTGVNFGYPTVQERLARGDTIGIGPDLLPAYTEGAAQLQDLVTTSRAGLDSLATAMPDLLAAWDAAFGSTLSPL